MKQNKTKIDIFAYTTRLVENDLYEGINNMKTKKQQVKDLFNQGKLKDALKIAKTFKIEFDEIEQKTISLAYDCIVHPRFYDQLKINKEDVIKAAEKILKDYTEDF